MCRDRRYDTSVISLHSIIDSKSYLASRHMKNPRSFTFTVYEIKWTGNGVGKELYILCLSKWDKIPACKCSAKAHGGTKMLKKREHVTSERGVQHGRLRMGATRNRVAGKSNRKRPEVLGSQGGLSEPDTKWLYQTKGSRWVGSKKERRVFTPGM